MKNTPAILVAVLASGFFAAVGYADTLAIIGTPVSTSSEVRSEDFESSVLGVSADGTYVIGEVAGTSGFTVNEYLYNTQTKATQFFALSAPITGISTTPQPATVRAISGDGTTVGGMGTFAATDFFQDQLQSSMAATWSTASLSTPPVQVGVGSLPITNMPGVANQLPASYVTGLSNDGGVVVGESVSSLSVGTSVSQPVFAFRYTAASGYVQLPGLNGNPSTGSNPAQSAQASGVSANGNVIAGYAYNSDGQQAVVWTVSGSSSTPIVTTSTLSNLGGRFATAGNTFNPNQIYALVNAISADGKTVVGQSLNTSGLEVAVRWTSSDNWGTSTLTALPLLANETGSDALGVSADGNLIVGAVSFPNFVQDGFIYNVANNQMETLTQLLTADGLISQIAGWTELSIVGISADGSTLTVEGDAPFSTTRDGGDFVTQSFVVLLNGSAVPEPASLGLLAAGAAGFLVRRRRA